MKVNWKRIISLVLAACLLLGLLPAQAMAYYTPAGSKPVIQTANGALEPEDDWDEVYPYGAFALDAAELTLSEGGEGTITLYRLGGTTGRATVLVRYEPVVYANEDQSPNYANALSSGDVTIRVEETQSAAWYQPVGKAPDPLEPEGTVSVRQSRADENGDVVLTLSEGRAERWQWYILSGGDWKTIGKATEAALTVAEADLDGYDFRCVYTLGGVTYCSDSLLGREYVRPAQETLEERPEDVPLWSEPSYLPLAMDEADPYSGYAFAVTFAEDEWVKELRVTIEQDDEAEADEFATFRLAGCEGGAILDAASTLILHAVDDETPEAAEVGFALTQVRADKSAGVAEVTVRRTGGTQNVLSVDWATADGTAKAGTDYVEGSGTLAFYAGVDELTIRVELIDDKIVSREDTADFQLKLSNLKGGGDRADLYTLGADTAVVSLYNTAAGTGENLATVLYDAGVVDVSGGVSESGTIAAPAAGADLTGQQQEKSVGAVEIVSGSAASGDVSLFTYDYADRLSFHGGSWSGSYDTGYLEKKMYGRDHGPHNMYTNAYLNEMFTNLSGRVNFTAGMHEDYGNPTCSNPYFRIAGSAGKRYETGSDAHLEGGNSLWGGGTLYWTPWKYASYAFATDADGGDAKYLQFGQYGVNGQNLAGDYGRASTDGLTLTRRLLTGRFSLRIYTANDSDSANGATVLSEAAGAYEGIKPTITITDGGASNGRPYVGTTIQVNVPNSAAYFPAAQDSSLSYALFLMDAKGAVLRQVKAAPVTSGDRVTAYTMTLVWDGMTAADFAADYTLCLVMTRKQSIQVDVAPSVPRSLDEQGNVQANIDNSKIGETIENFYRDSHISYGCTPISERQSDRFDTITEVKAGDALLTREAAENSTLLKSNTLENLQWICFNLPATDKILFGGVVYDGNAKIWLRQADLASANLTFRYYQGDYAKVDSVMTTAIDRTALYLDANRNGRIDGWYNEATGTFVLTPVDGVSDQLVMFLEDGVDYDESIFAPQPCFDSDGAIAGYAQHFLKAFYTMTPRNLQMPEGGEDERAQVLPSFVTDVTGSAALGRMTEEQKSYRYIVSGLTRAYSVEDVASFAPSEGDYTRSADNHAMYGGEAGRTGVIDLPLGGDFHPLRIVGDTVTWEPQFKGSLLYPFAYPSPITIPHSLAGSNIPLAGTVADGSARGWSYADEAAALAQINGYLGSYVYNDTYALSVQVQNKTTDEIAAANGRVYQADGSGNIQVLDADTACAPAPEPESTNRYGGGLYENSDYLKVMNGTVAPDAGVDTASKSTAGTMSLMDGGDGGMFEMDVGTQLPAFEVGATDYVTVTVDGYEVGFSIGIPLGGYNSNGDAGTGGTGDGGNNPTPSPSPVNPPTPTPTPGNPPEKESNWFGPGKANAANGEDMAKLWNFIRGNSGAGELDDSWLASHPVADQNGKKADPEFTSKGFSVGFSVALAFLFKYDPVSNAYQFNQFTVAVSAELEFTLQYRLSFFPIVYIFLTFGGGIELTTGLTVDREVHEMSDKVTLADPEDRSAYTYAETLEKDQTVAFTTDIKAFHITFSGRLYLDYGDEERKGIIESDGSAPVLIIMAKQDGAKLSESKTVTLRAVDEETSITRVAKVDYSENNTYWNGLELSPSFMMEAGAGLGIVCFKLEIFLKFNVGATFLFGEYERDYKDGVYTGYHYNAAKVKSFELGIGLAVRAVFTVLSYEMDLIRYAVSYEDGEGWSTGWGAFGDRMGTLSVEDSNGDVYSSPISIGLLGSTADTQRIYTPDTGDVSLFAYQPSDQDAPFELSGYGSSGDAFKLVDGLITGYDYKVVSVDGANYLVYTVSRETAGEMDNMMLVLSKIKATTTNLNEKYALVNPLDETSATPYIELDNDKAGDLGFSAWTEGSAIHAAWVSYQAADWAAGGSVTVPASACPADMNKYNYASFAGKVAAENDPADVPAPEQPQPPAQTLAQPQPSSYYVTAAAYDPETHAGYTACPDEETPAHYLAPGYEDLPAAERAYQAALTVYEANRKAWEDYAKASAEYPAKQAAYEAWQSEQAEYDQYKAWYDYFAGSQQAQTDARALAFTAAQTNTVIRTAAFDTTQTEQGFTGHKTLSGTGTEHRAGVSLPDGAGDAVFYARAHHYTEDEIAQKTAGYQAHLYRMYSGVTDPEARQAMVAYGLQTALAQWQINGKYSELHASINGVDVGAALAKDADGAGGEVIENIDVLKKDANTYYAAYTTGLDSAQDSDLAHIRRLYLRALTKTGDTWDWGEARLLRTIVDYDQTDSKDGFYRNGALAGAYENPYFANLQFLNGKIGGKLQDPETLSLLSDGIDPEDFLLFEMNGAAYIIKADSLDSILTSGTGTLYPFFKAEDFVQADGTTRSQASSGRTAVTIGADSAGGIAAVYVSPVSGTVNNAVYLSRFDPETGTWSAGTMLAMRGMQIYEDSIANNWTAEEAQAAYLGKLEGYENAYAPKDDPAQFTFANLQAAVGVQVTSEGECKDTLLVLAQGSMLPLEERQSGGETILMPKSGADASVGIYALSYGIGGQGIGGDHLSFPFYQFTAGSKLYPTLSFTNTGDAAIRGSQANKITVKLMVQPAGGTGAVELGSWTVAENIRPGETVTLSGTVELDRDLQAGSVFYLTVSEDATYAESAFQATTLDTDADGNPTGTLVVEEKPELGFERFNLTRKGVDENGNTILEVDFQVGNRGSVTAEDVYVQFQYENGVDAATGAAAYGVLDITAAELRVSQEERLTLLDASTDTEKKNGILYLYNASDGGDIRSGYGRTVTGTLLVPPSCYQGAQTGSLNLKVEVFRDADRLETWTQGVRVAEHDEYDTLNNVQTKSFEHTTYLSAPDQLSLAMGNTLRLPVAALSTTGAAPVITATEAPPSVTGEQNHLGILYYNAADRTVVIVPSSRGAGVINLYDAQTNTTQAIAYTVSGQETGINIYKDNNFFTFINKNGGIYDENAGPDGQTWSFSKHDVPAWGADNTAPSRGDLSYAEGGSRLTFRTVASAIDLYVKGTVQVESTFPGFAAQTVAAEGGTAGYASISFGDNVTGYTHTVTITVPERTAEAVQFDKLVEYYYGNAVPTPADDGNAPQIYWSRSFPDTASIQSGSGSVALTCYVLDDTGLSSLTLNGTVPAALKQNSAGFWQFDAAVTQNQTLVVQARDQAGNTTARSVAVDWFAHPVSSNTNAYAPLLTTAWKISTDGGETYSGLPAGQYVKNLQKAALEVTGTPHDAETPIASAGVKFHEVKTEEGASGWELQELTALADQESLFQTERNGIYQATVTARDGTWATRFVLMEQMDSDIPTVTLEAEEADPLKLSWSSSKGANSASPLTDIRINGQSQTIRRDQTMLKGSFQAAFAGEYVLEAEDGAGNVATKSLTVTKTVPITLSEGAQIIREPWNQAADNGEYALDAARITGGRYDADRSKTETGRYQGAYEFVLLTGAEAPKDGAPPEEAQWRADTERLTGLKPGAYVLYLRDKNDPSNILHSDVTIGNAYIRYTAAVKRAAYGQSNGAIYVTASGGRDGAGLYQFALIPKTGSQKDLMDVAALTGWQSIRMPLAALNRTTLDALAAGDYQLGVRLMAGVTVNELQDLGTLYDAMTDAKARVDTAQAGQSAAAIRSKAAESVAEAASALQVWQTEAGNPETEAAYKERIGNDTAVLAALEAWLNAAEAERNAKKAAYDRAVSDYFTGVHTASAAAAKNAAEDALAAATAAYESERDRLNALADAAYEADPTLWENAATGFVSVEAYIPDGGSGASSAGQVKRDDLTYDETEKTVTVTFPEGVTKLSDSVKKQLVEDNKNYDILLRDEGLYVRIPAGTLQEGDDIARRIVRNDGSFRDLTGCVIVVTGADGTEQVLIWSSLTDSEFAYIASLPGSYRVVDASEIFYDVPPDCWGREVIAFAVAHELFRGVGGGRFAPNAAMSRAMFVTVLGRLAGIDPADYTDRVFPDADPDAWYGPYVQWASESGIVSGYGSGRFGPGDQVTREQMCTILARYLDAAGQKLPKAADAAAFTDAAHISPWAEEAVAACQTGGLIQGKVGGTFDPKGSAGRAEAAALFTRLIRALLKS